jgi:hypothetical protein
MEQSRRARCRTRKRIRFTRYSLYRNRALENDMHLTKSSDFCLKPLSFMKLFALNFSSLLLLIIVRERGGGPR